MKLTKKRRNEIYRKALKYFIETHENNIFDYYFGMCFTLKKVIAADEPNPFYFMNEYPEILKHKPKGEYFYWFDTNKENYQKRVNIFKQAIKETNK